MKEYDDMLDKFVLNGSDSVKVDETPVVTAPDFIEDAAPTDGGNLEKHTYIKKYSEVFGWDKSELKDYEDFDVVMYKDAYWNPTSLGRVPKLDAFKHRVVDHTVMYPMVLSMQPKFRGFKVMLVGPTGSGKSTAVEFYCAKVNQPFLRINGRSDMESDSVLGKPWVKGTTMEYMLGEWPRASANGEMVLVDEPWKMPPGIWMTAQRHLERGGIWQIDEMPGDNATDKQIIPKSSYRCILADNVVGTGDNIEQYGATLIQDSSTLNRIDVVIKVPYLKPKDEVKLITSMYPAIPEHMAKRMISMLNLLRTGFNEGALSSPASIRNIEAWAELAIDMKGNYKAAFNWVLMNRYANDSEAGAVRNHYYTTFGEAL